MVVAQAAHQFDGLGQRHAVLQVHAQAARLEAVVGNVAAAIHHPVAIVGGAHGSVGPRGGVGGVVVALGVVVVEVEARDDVVPHSTPIEAVGVVTLQLRHLGVADAAFGASGQHGGVGDVRDNGRAWSGKADGAGQQVARILAVAQAGLEFTTVVKAMGVAERYVLGRGVQVVAIETVEILGGQCRDDAAILRDPGVVVVWSTVDIQVVQADGEFVACAYAPGKRGRNAALALECAIVGVVLGHHVQAQSSVLAGNEVEVAGGSVVFARAKHVGCFVLID